MTWREFKAKVEKDGVTEDTSILYIDVDLRGWDDWSVRPAADRPGEVVIW